jgi:pimeloyl-ACP methyl ester carboxylesterase
VLPPVSFVEAHGQRLEYVDLPARGRERPELLFLHEGLGSVSMWRDFPARVAGRTGCRAIVYSRAGFGRSSARGKAYTPRFMHDEALETLPALRETLSIRHPLLVGHSTGASMALIHAGHSPAAGVVAMAPFAFVEESNLVAIRAARERYVHLRERLARHHDDVDGVFHGWNDTWLDPSFAGMNIDADLARIECPLLLVLGEKDEYCTPAQLAHIESRATRSKHVQALLLPESGHSPHRDEPERLVETIHRFIETLES